MPRKPKKYNFIYKTTNIITNKYYIGMHSTDDMDDEYIGSGLRLRRSINKYGVENHKFVILEHCNSRFELKNREKSIVNATLLLDPYCLNLAIGGEGGAINPWTPESRKQLSDKLKKRKNYWGYKVSLANKGRRIQTDESIKRAAESRRGSKNGSWKNINTEKIIYYRYEKHKTIDAISKLMCISISTIKRKIKEYKN